VHRSRKGTGIGVAKTHGSGAGHDLHGCPSRLRRMASEEPGPCQKYALQARKHIAVLRKARPDITIEIRWCPAHKGVLGNEMADEWAKLVAEEPDARGVGWRSYTDRLAARAMPLPRSLVHLEREVSGKKWAEASQWTEAGPPGRSTGCRAGRSPTSRFASRFY